MGYWNCKHIVVCAVFYDYLNESSLCLDDIDADLELVGLIIGERVFKYYGVGLAEIKWLGLAEVRWCIFSNLRIGIP